jgi:hypothetical protein
VNNLKKIAIFLLMMIIAREVSAQMSKSSELDSLFNMENWRPERVLKTDLADMLLGNYCLIYEQESKSFITWEIGVGLLTNHFFQAPLRMPFISFEKIPVYTHYNLGYSLLLTPKLNGGCIFCGYLSLPLRFYHYLGQVTYFETDLFLGRQRLFFDKLIIDFAAGPGIGFEKSLDGVSYISSPDPHLANGFNLMLRVDLKVGFRL